VKFVGPKRLRLQVGIKPQIRRVKLRYYFESLPALDLPG
jgi:hypothetical protein